MDNVGEEATEDVDVKWSGFRAIGGGGFFDVELAVVATDKRRSDSETKETRRVPL